MWPKIRPLEPDRDVHCPQARMLDARLFSNGRDNPGRVLVIDDSPLALEIVRSTLETAGFEVVTATNGPDGIGLVDGFAPNVVVSDLNMPQMNGVQVVAALRVRAPRLPVLIFTDSAEVEGAVEAMREGAFGYVLKAADGTALVHEVHAAAEHERLKRRNEELERQNRAYQAEAEAARMAQVDRLAAMGTLAACIAHEINNPLAYVSSNLVSVQRQLKDFADGKIAPAALRDALDALEESQEGIERVKQIARDLRGLSREDERRERVDLREVLECASRMAAAAIRPRAQFEQDLAARAVLLANEGRLTQVFLNLLVNAGQAIPEGARSGKVKLSARIEGDVAVVEVSDTGCGIPPQVKARLFEPFFTTKPRGVGTGLGLSVCHGIVTAHGGRISAESEVGKGTTFRVELPLAKEEPSAA